MRIPKTLLITLFLFFLFASSDKAFAEAPYQGYIYNEWDESVPVPNGYLPAETYTGSELNAGEFLEPSDLFVDNNKLIYIADSGNNRIVILDEEFKLIEVIEKVWLNDEELSFSNPTGIYISNKGQMYIADEGNARIIRLNQEREVELVIENLDHPLIPNDFEFRPSKLVADHAGRIYVQSTGNFYGLLQFNPDGDFMGYYGSNKIEVTPSVLLESFWKSILSKEQRDSMVKLLPIEYSNVAVDKDGFIYTTTIVSENNTMQIKKLNPLGDNVLKKEGNKEISFGDLEINQVKGRSANSSFIDVDVDSNGFIIGLDRTFGRIFETDKEGNLLTVFGGLGTVKGTFTQPVAAAYLGEKVLVLDAGKRNITVFEQTEYGELLMEALILYNDGMYSESAELWQEVVKRSSNNTLAYRGIAKALIKDERYEDALYYAEIGADRETYSQAFSYIRINFIRDNLPIFLSILIFGVVGYYSFKIIRTIRIRKKEVIK